MTRFSNSRGVTLVELVVTITVLAAAAAALLGAMSYVAKDSGDAMVRQQAATIAHAYLDEVLSRPGGPNAVVEPTRAQFDNVLDFNGLNNANGARDQFDNLIPGLGNYAVNVTVVNGMLGAGAMALPVGTARRVDVTVTHSTGIVAIATGYRTP
jgi:prepilin-type N-terminal cleavage/methylation domain-containing protein